MNVFFTFMRLEGAIVLLSMPCLYRHLTTAWAEQVICGQIQSYVDNECVFHIYALGRCNCVVEYALLV